MNKVPLYILWQNLTKQLSWKKILNYSSAIATVTAGAKQIQSAKALVDPLALANIAERTANLKR